MCNRFRNRIFIHRTVAWLGCLILSGCAGGTGHEYPGKAWKSLSPENAGFDPVKVARFTDKRIEKLLTDPSIVRNRLKVNSAVTNAKAFLKVQKEFGTFCDYIWEFVGGKPLQTNFKNDGDIPATSPESDALSKDLKKRGFKFVGSTIIYAHMQATGMVNDHVQGCFRHKPCKKLKSNTA